MRRVMYGAVGSIGCIEEEKGLCRCPDRPPRGRTPAAGQFGGPTRKLNASTFTSTSPTRSLPFDEWTSVYGNQRLAGALLDRLTHHVHIPQMNGESYRLKQSKARRPQGASARCRTSRRSRNRGNLARIAQRKNFRCRPEISPPLTGLPLLRRLQFSPE